MANITQILSAIEQGDVRGAGQLVSLVYVALCGLIERKVKSELPQMLEAPALVQEAYMRLVGDRHKRRWDLRGHFFAAASEAMRRILVEHARRANEQKPPTKVAIAADRKVNILALDEALRRFELIDDRKAELVKLRYFAGLTIHEAADAMGISATIADRYWSYARAWLVAELTRIRLQ